MFTPWTFLNASASVPPVLTSLSCDVFDYAGGDSITIFGTNLSGATLCTVNGASVVITANTSSLLTFTTNPLAVGTYNVQVTTGGGASNTLSIESFHPGVLSKCVFWVRADLGISVTSGSVNSWASQVDGGDAAKTLTSTGTARPTLNASDSNYNGKPTLSFDGSQSQRVDHSTSDWATPIAQPSEGFTVGQIDSTGEFFDGRTGGRNILGYSTKIAAYPGTTFVTGTTNPGGGKLVASGVFNDTSSKIYVNDSQTAQATGGSGTDSMARMAIGAKSSSSGGYLFGKVAEVAFFNAPLTNAERLRLYKYAGLRYGIATS